jgi:hypothetical protein
MPCTSPRSARSASQAQRVASITNGRSPRARPRRTRSAPSSDTSATPSTDSSSPTPPGPGRRAREGTQERLCRPAWPASILQTGSSDQATSRTRQATVRPWPAGRSFAPTHASKQGLTQRGFVEGYPASAPSRPSQVSVGGNVGEKFSGNASASSVAAHADVCSGRGPSPTASYGYLGTLMQRVDRSQLALRSPDPRALSTGSPRVSVRRRTRDLGVVRPDARSRRAMAPTGSRGSADPNRSPGLLVPACFQRRARFVLHKTF